MGGALKRATRARVVLPTHCALNGVVERPLARYRTSASDSSLWLQWVDDRHSHTAAEWLQPVGDRRTRRSQPTRQDYTSVCSAISRASSTSIPRYLTVLSSLVCPSRS